MLQLERLPAFFEESSNKANRITVVPYNQRAAEAIKWAKTLNIMPINRTTRQPKVALVGIDYQLTFCNPEVDELFVSGNGGNGSVRDSVRMALFIYRYLHVITKTIWTLDSHKTYQIFYPLFWIDNQGSCNPAPYTHITHKDVLDGKWRANPRLSFILGKDPSYWQEYALYYTKELEKKGRYSLVIWPYHAMTGSVGQALVPILDEASFFHSVARFTERIFEIKGDDPRTENYSVFQPEITNDHLGNFFGERNRRLTEILREFDMVIFGGEAGDYCLPWSIEDFLAQLKEKSLIEKLYLLKDTTSPVVVDGYNGTGNMRAAFERFKEAGMNIVKSTDPMETWPNIEKIGFTE